MAPSSFSNFQRRDIENLLIKHPNRIPIEVKSADSQIQLRKTRFLIDNSLSFGQFMAIVRRFVNLKSDQAMFAFVNGNMVPFQAPIEDIWKLHYNSKKVLIVHLNVESTFG